MSSSISERFQVWRVIFKVQKVEKCVKKCKKYAIFCGNKAKILTGREISGNFWKILVLEHTCKVSHAEKPEILLSGGREIDF